MNSIQNDVQWLGFTWDGDVKYSSNYFDALYGYAVELIEKGLAYVDFSQEAMREMRGTLTAQGTNSPYRDTDPTENLALFSQMREGKFKEGECCLRAKIDMASPFMCMRDPVLYRVKFAHHHQTGDKWCIYLCMILLIVYLMRLKIFLTHCVRLSFKIIVVCTIG